MFFEDVNTLYEKYKYCSFWYELSYDDIVDNVGNMVDFFNITKPSNVYIIDKMNQYCGFVYLIDDSSKPSKYPEGEEITVQYVRENQLSPNQSMFIYVFCDVWTPLLSTIKWIPISPMHVLRCGDESETVKVYLKAITEMPTTLKVGTGKYIDDEGNMDVDLIDVSVLSDGDGHYVELSSRRDGDEFTIINGSGGSFQGKLIECKPLPSITFNTLYRGNTQEILVYFDGELVDSKYYDLLYQNNVLADNVISIDETLTEIELEIYLKHPEYISTKLKYKVPVSYYNVANQSDLETAIEMGLTTIFLNKSSINLTGVEISNMKFRKNSLSGIALHLDDCKFNNCDFERFWIYINTNTYFNTCGFNRITMIGNITVDSKHFTYNSKAYLNHCTITDSTLNTVFIVSTNNSKFTNNEIQNRTLIFSDEMITLIGNTFQSIESWSAAYTEYYPLMLYLTGNFNCKDNQFNINNNYSDFMFSTAVLKTIPETDIDDFIRLNHFNITMNVDNTAYNGLFYCLIDESKLKYKEL